MVRFFLDSVSQVVHREVVHSPPAESLAQTEVERRVQNRRAVVDFQQPYGPGQLVAHSPRGGWAEAVSSRYSIRWHGPLEAFEHHISRDITGPPLSASEHQRAQESLQREVERWDMTLSDLPFGIPERKPPLRTLRYDRAGRLWVFLSVPEGAPSRGDIYDREGRAVATVEWPASVDLRNGNLGTQVLLAVSTDSLGVQRVVRLLLAAER